MKIIELGSRLKAYGHFINGKIVSKHIQEFVLLGVKGSGPSFNGTLATILTTGSGQLFWLESPA
jgi:hypothetical protein